MPFSKGSVFSRSFESAQQTLTAGGTLSLAHGLGVVPKVVELSLVCQVDDAGYVAGKVLQGAMVFSNFASGSWGISPQVDATNVDIKFGSSAAVAWVVNGTTGAVETITAASWKLVVRAFA